MLTGRWSLSLSPEVFHFTPHYTRLFPSACCLSLTALLHPLPLSLPLSFSCSHTSSFSSLHACLLCWLHVKCQVQSQLTDPLWHVCGCKTSKVMSPPLPPILLLPSLPLILLLPSLCPRGSCISKLQACREANMPSVVSKELLG